MKQNRIMWEQVLEHQYQQHQFSDIQVKVNGTQYIVHNCLSKRLH